MSRRKQANGESNSEIEWERIMVQITFAFVIILGYLVSVGLDEANELAAETQSQKDRNEVLERLLENLRGTDLGEAEAGRIVAEKKLQREELLRVWAEERVRRDLYTLIRQFDKAELIPLSDDLACLPTAASFGDLNGEIERVFMAKGQDVSIDEVGLLIARVLQLAGYDLNEKMSELLFNTEQLSSEVAALMFDRNAPTRENLVKLKEQIVFDLRGERRQMIAIQEALVAKIASARRDKLADLPLAPETGPIMDQADPGRFMLDWILDDLKESVKLLPETIEGICGDRASD